MIAAERAHERHNEKHCGWSNHPSIKVLCGQGLFEWVHVKGRKAGARIKNDNPSHTLMASAQDLKPDIDMEPPEMFKKHSRKITHLEEKTLCNMEANKSTENSAEKYLSEGRILREYISDLGPPNLRPDWTIIQLTLHVCILSCPV